MALVLSHLHHFRSLLAAGERSQHRLVLGSSLQARSSTLISSQLL